MKGYPLGVGKSAILPPVKASSTRERNLPNWRLPRWFFPDGNKPALTYHPDPKRWRRDANHAYLRSVGRGQEFVLDLAHYPEASEWLSDLVSKLGSDTRG